ncbi:TIGR03986 family type III CRISPR-associated RAMP protein [Clostridium frigidicarnis]|uniref:CRISPR-associated protein n=1 Tax=Clostridium frigidicarnis TaxID=84698 RepID=A0A1I0V868_9CLOT|nr:TIGR03986 family CRISPR-associated RAMP protein [Clostridium frigidicarnis]SFA71756.1 CRISPR-associated protein [Clostridium frigidicarnis]
MINNHSKFSNKNKEYARSPYNFIPFPKNVFYRHNILEDYNNKEKTVLPKHNEFIEGLKTGYIDYLIEVETPLFISNGKNDFLKINNEFIIPGSTVRGKVRSNVEVLSCSYPEFVEDKKLWFRGAFSKDVLKEMYKQTLLPSENSRINDKVKAGYLHMEGNKWFIIPAKEDNNHKSFRELHERKLRDSHRSINGRIKKEIFMYNEIDKLSKKPLWDLFFSIKQEKKSISKKLKETKKTLSKNEIEGLEKELNIINNKLDDLLKNNKLRVFTPYYYSVLYDFNDNNSVEIKKVVESINDNEYGFLMNSANLNKKQNHYLIFKKDTDKGNMSISEELINQYKTSVKYKQGKEIENFKIDVENSFTNHKDKPVFYILDEEESIISFGFTPYLKIPYKKSVRDGIKTKIENEKVDYTNSIFGFSNFKYKKESNEKTISYKGRVSFTNAKPIKACKQIKEPILKYLMNPKISSFQLYLKQDSNNAKKLKTYSSENFELRGKKFYWLRDKHNELDAYKNELQEFNDKKKKEPKKDQYASLYPVDKGAIFKGRIYFENLFEDELGLLLMSIKPFENARENLGQGKPYGYGKVKFIIEDVIEINSKNRFMSLNIDSSEVSIKSKKDFYINTFKNYMKKQNINVDFYSEPMYKCFYQSKSQIKEISDREFNYMTINEFKNRNTLKSMEDYVNEYKVENTEECVAVSQQSEDDYWEYMENILSNKFEVKRDRRKEKK